MVNHPITKETIKKWKELDRTGMKRYEIAKLTGYHSQTVSNHLPNTRRDKLSKDEIKGIIKLYNEWVKVKEIAKRYNASKHTIFGVIFESKVSIDRKNEQVKQFKDGVDNLTDFEIGYIAGMIDGEGYIGITKGKNKDGRIDYHTNLTIANCNVKMLNYIKRLLPFTKIYDNGHNRQDGRKWKRGYIITIRKQGYLKLLLDRIYPFLVGKKEVAKQMLNFINTDDRKERDKIVIEIKKLNKRGVDK